MAKARRAGKTPVAGRLASIAGLVYIPALLATSWETTDHAPHSRKYDLFPAMHVKMAEFIRDAMGVSGDEALAIQARFGKNYGTTLRGLMVEHKVHPDAFLEYVHDLDLDQIQHEPALDAAIGALPGRKVVFTNATVSYATKVMQRLGITHHFEDVFDVAAALYIPKPQMPAYDEFLKRTGVEANKAIFFEDMARNLAPAHEIGMTTVWVENERHNALPEPDSQHVHYIAEDLTNWLEAAAASR
jgi:putative hydrolase of the HAD superfamily